MAIILNLNQSQSVAGLGTSTYTVPASVTGLIPLTVEVKSTIQPGSGLEIVINQNGSPIVDNGGDSDNPSATQLSIGAVARLSCAAADVITVVLSSSAAIDALPNSVKSTINLFQAE